ncbi:MAG: hypothetical protein ACTSR3_01100 [Candidatus Helarchaeota archaeon]
MSEEQIEDLISEISEATGIKRRILTGTRVGKIIPQTLDGFEKVLDKRFECMDCKYVSPPPFNVHCDRCLNFENLQLNDETLAEIKEKMRDADDRGEDIHPRYWFRTMIKLGDEWEIIEKNTHYYCSKENQERFEIKLELIL